MGLTDLTFRGLKPSRIQALFRRFAASPQVSTLDIDISSGHTIADANSLLRAAAQLSPSPGQLCLTFQESYPYLGYSDCIHLPCFHGTSSIEIHSLHFDVRPPQTGEFTALESLSVAGKVLNLGSLLNRCPCLRVLSLSYPEMHPIPITLPPALEIPKLEKLYLSGKFANLCSVLNSCQRLRMLCVTQTKFGTIRPPPSGECPMLEKLSISGKITDLDTLLNQCPGLRVLDITLRGMRLSSIKAELTVLEMAGQRGLMLPTLGIEIPWRDDITPRQFAYLLRIVARISPRELVFTDSLEGCNPARDKKIKVNVPSSEFSRLERLSLSTLCRIADIGTLVARCPCLRVLRAATTSGKVMLHSSSLQKLDLNTNCDTEFHNINIATPVLKELNMAFRAAGDIGVSISAPVLENVSWQRSYTGPALVFGFWRLGSLRIQTIQRSNDVKTKGMPSLMQLLPPFHVLCLHLSVQKLLDTELNFADEVEKLPVTNFSVLEINIQPAWHVYGALMLRLLRMHRVCASTKILKVVMPRWSMKEACLQNCPCDKPKKWRSQSIFSTCLEEVEIHGFNGQDHEYDFIRIILACSPKLGRVSVEPSDAFKGCTTVLSNISMDNPSVKFYSSNCLVTLASGAMLLDG
ncbi:hypothetical protein QYE76_014926 [Lolium multiflorum]|uniref:Uncharacterized protein n=1 Tax=Lolium multiflorum TaxID=4521 RepID=A0AAD8U5M5_LOLMU|nr:hypothetical protein QYE76_014926 [Lolium multiflorum]